MQNKELDKLVAGARQKVKQKNPPALRGGIEEPVFRLCAEERLGADLRDKHVGARNALSACPISVRDDHGLGGCAVNFRAVHAEANTSVVFHQEAGEAAICAVKNALKVTICHSSKSLSISC